MNALAAYAINQHLADLVEESRQNRLARGARTARPSIARRALAALRDALARPAADTTPAAA